MNKLQVFNFKDYPLRTDYKDNQAWFCLIDVCTVLEIKDRFQLRKRLNKRGMCQIPTPSRGGLQKTYFVNFSNLIKCVLRSDKPEALEFENWVCEDVLPSIFQTGSYSLPNTSTIVREHKRALPSKKKEIVLSEKAKQEIGGIAKAVVTKTLDEKLPLYLRPSEKLPDKVISAAFHQTADEMQEKKKGELKEYHLSRSEAEVIEIIRSANTFNMLNLFMGVSNKLSA